MGNATFVGLGPKVWQVLSQLAKEGTIDPAHVMKGALHASPENTYCVDYLTGDHGGPVPWKANPQACDQGEVIFDALVLGLLSRSTLVHDPLSHWWAWDERTVSNHAESQLP